MTKLPHLTGKELITHLKRHEFVVLRQKGSHVILRHALDLHRRCVVPLHSGKIIKPGTFLAIIKGAGLTIEELLHH